MKILVPMPVDSTSILTATNLAEDNSSSAWSSGTTYAAGDFAYDGSTHRVYRSVQGSNLNNAPASDDGTWWVDYSATNRWKAFDQTISDPATNTGDIEYTLTADQRCSHIAFFGLQASQVQVAVKDTLGTTVHDETKSIADTSGIVDWYTYFVGGIDYETEILFEDLPIFSGYDVEITVGAVSGGGSAAVGQIIAGLRQILGQTLVGTEVGFRSFSVKTQDEFGNLTITQRGYADSASFQFALDTADVRRVKRILTENEATPCVFWADSDILETGTFIYGFFNDAAFPLSAGKTFATLDIKGLV